MYFETSVLIISKDRPTHVKELVLCLNRQTRYPNELVLVEDISNQKHFSQKLLSELTCKLFKTKYVEIKASNYAKSRNKSLKFAKGNLLFFIDDDVTIPKDFIQKSLAIFKNHSNIMGVVPRINPVSKSKYSLVASKLLNWETANLNTMSKVGSFAFACAIIKKQALKNICFDENTYTGEDIIFSTKLIQTNNNFYFVPNLKVEHNFADNFLSFFKKFYRYGRDFPYAASILRNDMDTLYYPKRKANLIFLPIFVFKNIYQWSRQELKYFRLDKTYLKILIYYHLALYLGVLTSKEGRKKLFRVIM